MSEKKGFTLVELLVVIAIIALLMSILMPALARVRKQAKTVMCQTNLKQWGTCFAAYTNEWDGYFMPGWIAGAFNLGINDYEVYWMYALRSCYGDEGDLRLCPSAVKPGTELGHGEFGNDGGPFSAWGVFTEAWSYAYPGDSGSYGWNGFAGNPPPGEGIWNPQNKDYNWRRANVNGAANIPLLLDHQWVDCWPGDKDEPPDYDGQPWNETSQMGRFLVNRHEGFLNTVFFDFSVRKFGLKEPWTFKWNRGFNTTDIWTAAGGVVRADWPEWMHDFKDY
ncbi:MAG: type II secretion system protein [Planctomycetota bacterium]|jgi:prepilin-type N-terminal cleavage/methylation domain-containing protein